MRLSGLACPIAVFPVVGNPGFAQHKANQISEARLSPNVVGEKQHASSTALEADKRVCGLTVMAAPALPEFRWHPSVDRLTASAMDHLDPSRLVGILMTGMGNDGARTMGELRRRGGRTIAEAEVTAVVWGMPGELVKAGGADVVAPLDRIAGRLIDLVASA